MIDILKNQDLVGKIDELRTRYNNEAKNPKFLDGFFDEIEDADEWIYSTGPVFDQPPYALEMAGFDTGRILKKKYISPYEARVKGAYSSGFSKGNHFITIFPSKPASMPLQANFFHSEEKKIITRSIISNKSTPHPHKPPKLLGIGEIFDFRENVRAYIGAGKGSAYIVRLFFYDENNLLTSSSMVTAPNNYQNDFYFHYNEGNELQSIDCGGIVWERK